MTGLIAVTYHDKQQHTQASQLATRLNLPLVDSTQNDYSFFLIVEHDCLQLQPNQTEKMSAIKVDFLQGAARHRRLYGGGRGQLIAKACGLKKAEQPLKILDLTAGLGRDAFILACLGAQVTMLERSPIIAALLDDGLRRLTHDPELSQALHLKLIQRNAIDYLQHLSPDNYPDVIYIDPMHPARSKSAMVKKEMRLLREIVGNDVDAAGLLKAAFSKAGRRVVVKRPRHADALAGIKPSAVFEGKSTRFDVYFASCVDKSAS